MRKNIFILTAAVFMAAFISPANGFGQRIQRITFKRGAIQAVISGNLNNYKSKKVFTILVGRGQTLKTEQIKAGNSLHYITVSIKNSAGETVGDSDASCNNRKIIKPTMAGDYQITIFECRKADAWRGSFRLKVTVK